MHVLSLPPAFVLSQDQTLMLIDENSILSIITHKEFLRFLYHMLDLIFFSNIPSAYPLKLYSRFFITFCHHTPTLYLKPPCSAPRQDRNKPSGLPPLLSAGETAYKTSLFNCQHIFLIFFIFFLVFIFSY